MFANIGSMNGNNLSLNISNWDTSSVTGMVFMFYDCNVFSLDLSNWCVSNIPNEPDSFATNAPFANTTSNLPVWGTCP